MDMIPPGIGARSLGFYPAVDPILNSNVPEEPNLYWPALRNPVARDQTGKNICYSDYKQEDMPKFLPIQKTN